MDPIFNQLNSDINGIREDMRRIEKRANDELRDAKQEIKEKDAKIDALDIRLKALERIEIIQNWIQKTLKWVIATLIGAAAATAAWYAGHTK